RRRRRSALPGLEHLSRGPLRLAALVPAAPRVARARPRLPPHVQARGATSATPGGAAARRLVARWPAAREHRRCARAAALDSARLHTPRRPRRTRTTAPRLTARPQPRGARELPVLHAADIREDGAVPRPVRGRAGRRTPVPALRPPPRRVRRVAAGPRAEGARPDQAPA